MTADDFHHGNDSFPGAHRARCHQRVSPIGISQISEGEHRTHLLLLCFPGSCFRKSVYLLIVLSWDMPEPNLDLYSRLFQSSDRSIQLQEEIVVGGSLSSGVSAVV